MHINIFYDKIYLKNRHKNSIKNISPMSFHIFDFNLIIYHEKFLTNSIGCNLNANFKLSTIHRPPLLLLFRSRGKEH